jgi:hypothetical protein
VEPRLVPITSRILLTEEAYHSVGSSVVSSLDLNKAATLLRETHAEHNREWLANSTLLIADLCDKDMQSKALAGLKLVSSKSVLHGMWPMCCHTLLCCTDLRSRSKQVIDQTQVGCIVQVASVLERKYVPGVLAGSDPLLPAAAAHSGSGPCPAPDAVVEGSFDAQVVELAANDEALVANSEGHSNSSRFVADAHEVPGTAVGSVAPSPRSPRALLMACHGK